jgi:prepilin-type N-terminal cleavage/methylation domain-containing protein
MNSFETNPSRKAESRDNSLLCVRRVSAVKQSAWLAVRGFNRRGATNAEKPASRCLRISDFFRPSTLPPSRRAIAPLRRDGGGLRPSPQGFTLVEILVTVALMSFIIQGLLTMFSQTQRAFVGSMTQVDVLEAGRDVIEMVVNDLANMTPSEQPNVLNFYADTNELCINPLVQGLPGSAQLRNNLMQKFYFLSKNNLVWSGVGYQVVPDDANGVVGTLYRFSTNISVYALPAFTGYLTNSSKASYSLVPNPTTAYTLFVTSNKIADGIVHFRVRAFATNGFPILSSNVFNNGGGASFRSSGLTSWTSNGMNNAYATNRPAYWPTEPMGYWFWNNAMPAEIELEVGILEPQILRTYQGMAAGVAAPQINYLSNHVANVHLFRQRIRLGNVDPYAY